SLRRGDANDATFGLGAVVLKTKGPDLGRNSNCRGEQQKSDHGVMVATMVEAPSMSAQIIDGKKVGAEVEAEVRARLTVLNYRPSLVAVRVGNDPASEVYVRNKARKARELGLRGDERIFPA